MTKAKTYKCHICGEYKRKKDFYKDKTKRGELDGHCKVCRKKRNDQSRKQRSDLYNKRMELLRIQAVNSSCPVCQETIEDGQKYHYHHRHPWDKRFNLSRPGTYSEELWAAEQLKCDHLHCRCHFRVHNLLRGWTKNPLPEVIKYVKNTIGDR